MDEDCLPDTKLKLMELVNGESLEDIKALRKQESAKGILNQGQWKNRDGLLVEYKLEWGPKIHPLKPHQRGPQLSHIPLCTTYLVHP